MPKHNDLYILSLTVWWIGNEKILGDQLDDDFTLYIIDNCLIGLADQRWAIFARNTNTEKSQPYNVYCLEESDEVMNIICWYVIEINIIGIVTNIVIVVHNRAMAVLSIRIVSG